MATGVMSSGRASIKERTFRRDRWWSSPLGTAAILLFFIIYATVRIFMGDHYWSDEGHYLTPLYSPCLSEACVPGSSHFGTPMPELPPWIPMPFITFIVLAGFRATCYYYRKAGYRSLFLSPAACAVPEPHRKYTGERRFPLMLLNYHRYFFYGSLVFALINIYDGVLAFLPTNDNGNTTFGFGLGTLILWINVAMLVCYTLSCHACRHIMGGRVRNFSKHPMLYRYWSFVSKLNGRHGQYAMISLFTVIITDAYIMSVSAGWLTDLRFVN